MNEPLQPRRLRVIQDGRQDCSTCRNLAGCWTPRGKRALPETAVIENLLVCRLKRRIDRERSTRLLLKVLNPEIKRTARSVTARTNLHFTDVVRDLESTAILSLTERYEMGEAAPPRVWLFNPKYGALRHAARQMVDAEIRLAETQLSYSDAEDEFEDALTRLNAVATEGKVRTTPSMPPPSLEEHEVNHRFAEALAVAEDGRTLSTNEYRVFAFVLASGGRGAAQRFLAGMLNIARQDVTRVYGLAYRRVLEAAGLRTDYLKARGIDVAARSYATEEVARIVAALPKAGAADLAFATGVTPRQIYYLRKRARAQ